MRPPPTYAGPMVLIPLLFLLLGAVTNFNNVLMSYLRDCTPAHCFSVDSRTVDFFGAYFLMSLPAGLLVMVGRGLRIAAVLRAVGLPSVVAASLFLFKAARYQEGRHSKLVEE